MRCFHVVGGEVTAGLPLSYSDAVGTHLLLKGEEATRVIAVHPRLHQDYVQLIEKLKGLVAQGDAEAESILATGIIWKDDLGVENTEIGSVLSPAPPRAAPHKALVLVERGGSRYTARSFQERAEPAPPRGKFYPMVQRTYNAFPPIGVEVLCEVGSTKLLTLSSGSGFIVGHTVGEGDVYLCRTVTWFGGPRLAVAKPSRWRQW